MIGRITVDILERRIGKIRVEILGRRDWMN